ncbi:uncharacterized protein [Centroberyx affinis]|uniref:uncharacterized protein n=1 Tax=Centroberyx affinis TaxID=166261 RepID=UPI003A5BCA98
MTYEMLSRTLIPLLLNLAHLLAKPVTDSTTEALWNQRETTTSKSNTNAEPLSSSLLATANGTFKKQGTLTTSSAAFHNSKQPGRDSDVSQTTAEQLSIVQTQLDDTSQLNVVNNGDVSTQANTNKISTTPLYLDFGPIQGNNQTSLNKNKTLNITQGCNPTSPKCKEGDWRSLSHQSSRLVCFITLWLLGVTASVFLGLTICLWVRLSVQQGRTVSAGQRGTARGIDLKNLWVAHRSTPEERVEFWYTSGMTIRHDNVGGREEKKTKHKSERRREGRREEEKLWTQPKVTLKDITEFWYSHERLKPEDPTNQT